MDAFEYSACSPRVSFGVGSSTGPRLREAVRSLGLERLLLVRSQADARLAAPVARGLRELVVATFDEVRQHVPAASARRAGAAARRARADGLVCVGGGSTTGLAKVVARDTGLPIIAVPTTYAGSEVTPVWGETRDGHKTTGVDLAVLPELVVYDPALTLTLPLALSVASGLNAMAHCLEALWSPRRNPVTSLLALDGIRALRGGLVQVRATPTDQDARSQVLYGAWLAGASFAACGSDLHHRVCHVLGGAFDLPHAATHAAVLPYATALKAPSVDGLDAALSEALGSSGRPAHEAVAELERRLEAVGTLADLGLDHRDVGRAVDLAGRAVAGLPEPPSTSQLATMLEAAVTGAPTSLVAAVAARPAAAH